MAHVYWINNHYLSIYITFRPECMDYGYIFMAAYKP